MHGFLQSGPSPQHQDERGRMKVVALVRWGTGVQRQGGLGSLRAVGVLASSHAQCAN